MFLKYILFKPEKLSGKSRSVKKSYSKEKQDNEFILHTVIGNCSGRLAEGRWKERKSRKKAGAECICLFAIEFGIGN